MKAWFRIAMLVTLPVCGTTAFSAPGTKPAVDESTPTGSVAAVDDNMTPYRTLAADALQAFKAHDMTTAKTKAK
jgi:hypothetical protein